ncbi:flavodoxin family protein [Clostridium sp. AWRP]|uniref:flavodoxin family protein n=1 Tax=Clostridium sp. AWRP TaxID=2212991 RepID=UPI000FDA07B5|nr:flavodoxin family protein [Clostridium sp. AWRP]AZV57509.1 flavodoxin family protein [Clostridium sp. AWRP]
MKILFLNGSPRKNGYTVAIMKCIEKAIDPKHTVEWIHAYDLNIKPCRSCLKCRPDRICVLSKDDGHDVWHKICSADAVVIGSPTYFGNMSGPLKILIDRNLTAFEKMGSSGLEKPIPLHKGKKAAVVTACNSPFPISQLINQGKGTLQAVETVFKAGEFSVIGSIILDGAGFRNGIPLEIQEQAKIIGVKLQS